MDNINQILNKLAKRGFRIIKNDGSRAKIYPPDKNQSFYSAHLSGPCLHPLKRFAKREWNLDLEKI